MTAYTLSLSNGAFSLTGENGAMTATMAAYSLALAMGGIALTGENSFQQRGEPVADGVTVSALATYVVLPGALVAEQFTIAGALTLSAAYGCQASSLVALASRLLVGFPVGVSETVDLSGTPVTALALAVLDALYMRGAPAPMTTFGMGLAETMLLASGLWNFFAGELSETMRLAGSISPIWQFSKVQSDIVALQDSAASSLLVSLTAADGVDLGDANPLQMIYDGQLADGLTVNIAFISPNNTVTTWAINTRTSAVTEYRNFPFVSYAPIGDKYIGASAQGLYELNGADDAGQNIVASIASGLMQLGGSKFTSFKAAYLGTRQSGEFILRLTTGPGAYYDYLVKARPMQTTRVTLGKGLRARYFKYELIAIDGHDFDLDNIEFLPIVSQRRVD